MQTCWQTQPIHDQMLCSQYGPSLQKYKYTCTHARTCTHTHTHTCTHTHTHMQAATSLFHPRDNVFGEMECCCEVDRNNQIPLVIREALKRTNMLYTCSRCQDTARQRPLVPHRLHWSGRSLYTLYRDAKLTMVRSIVWRLIDGREAAAH